VRAAVVAALVLAIAPRAYAQPEPSADSSDVEANAKKLEEAAEKQAVAEARHRAMGRASIALEQKGQKLGALRYMSLDVKQLMGVAQLQTMPMYAADLAEVSSGASLWEHRARSTPTTAAPTQPQKIAVSASVQCAFEIQ